jgi:hypothetical protein
VRIPSNSDRSGGQRRLSEGEQLKVYANGKKKYRCFLCSAQDKQDKYFARYHYHEKRRIMDETLGAFPSSGPGISPGYLFGATPAKLSESG